MQKKSLPTIGAVVLMAASFVPGRWLGAQFCTEYGLVSTVELWLAVAAFGFATCAAASAIVSVFPVALEGGSRPARSLWLRVVSLAVFTVMISLLVFTDQVKIVVGMASWLSGLQST